MLISTNEIIEVDAKVCQCRRSYISRWDSLRGDGLPLLFLKRRRKQTVAIDVRGKETWLVWRHLHETYVDR